MILGVFLKFSSLTCLVSSWPVAKVSVKRALRLYHPAEAVKEDDPAKRVPPIAPAVKDVAHHNKQ